MIRSVLPALGALVLAGCASFAPTVPTGYTGPVAYLRETGFSFGNSGHLFYVESIDGKSVFSSMNKTVKENSGNGMGLRLSLVQHPLPATPLKLKLVGTNVTGAPIHEMALRASGKFLQTRKEVTFTPAPDGQYRVVGKLMPEGSDVWIEDTKTATRVTP
jgi:hypothetical protein